MAYTGPTWFIDPVNGFDSIDNGSESQPLETIAYAVSRIGLVGFGSNEQTIRVKKKTTAYNGVDLSALNPTSSKRLVLTSWDPATYGMPDFNGIVKIKNHMVVEGFIFLAADEGVQIDSNVTAVDDVLIRTNIFNLSANGYAITVGSAGLLSVSNLRVIQNTIVHKGAGTSHGLNFLWSPSCTGITNSVVSNSIFYGVDYAVYSDRDIMQMTNKGIVITHNNFFNLGTGQVHFTPAPVNPITTDPLFTNLNANNFTLQSTSPCADVGTNIETANLDIIGNLRPIYQTWDLGAYETQSPFLSQLVGGNKFDKDEEVIKTSLILPANILSVLSNPNFNNELLWERVLSVYHSPNGQKKVITHKKVGATWQGQVKFTADSESATWQKKEIILISSEGAGLSIGRDVLSNKEDLIIS